MSSGSTVYLVGPLYRTGLGDWQEPVIFVDRGAVFRRGKEGVSVGDGDSAGFPLDVPLPVDKDFSDLAFVLRLIPENTSFVQALGFLGGVLDHELINIGEVHQFLKRSNRPLEFRFDQRLHGFSAGSWELDIEGAFSVFVVEPAKVCLHGKCRFPVPEPREFLPMSSFGLSNEGQGKIGIHTNSPVFIYRR